MLFSVIVPVFNVEDYLCQCIDSILAQTYREFELILIDDGSPDKCPVICDNYAVKDNRVKVIHQQNGGLSAARNTGIDAATGDYIVFVDSDDWIETDALEGFCESIKQYNHPDILETTITDYNPDGTFFHHDKSLDEYVRENGFKKESALKWMTTFTSEKWLAPQMIVKTEFIISNGLRFCAGRLHEDMIWTPTVCNLAESFGCYSKSWYCYRKNRIGSITHFINTANMLSIIDNTNDIYNLYASKNKEAIFLFLIASIKSTYYHLSLLRCSNDDLASISKKIDEYKYLFSLKYAQKLQHKLFSLVIKILGSKRALLLLRKIKSNILK